MSVAYSRDLGMNVTYRSWLMTTASRQVIADVTAKAVKQLYKEKHRKD